jgi:rhodanese-related sulfurtransferase
MDSITKAEMENTLRKEKSALIINVLAEQYFEQQHIPGSINIPVKDNNHFVAEVDAKASSKNQKIIVYCASKDCQLSRKAVEKLLDAGFSNVWDYEPGTEGWFKDEKKKSA